MHPDHSRLSIPPPANAWHTPHMPQAQLPHPLTQTPSRATPPIKAKSKAMDSETQMLINVFKDKDLQALKHFIVEETTKAQDMKQVNKIMYALWIVTSDRMQISPKP